MKMVRFATIFASAGIAQVLAVPLVVLPPPTKIEDTPAVKFRFGHAVPMRTVAATQVIGEPVKKVPCGGRPLSRFRHKAVEISNIFRQALGLPLIQTGGPVEGNVIIWTNAMPPIHTVTPIRTFAPVQYGNKGARIYATPNMNPNMPPGRGHHMPPPAPRIHHHLHRHQFGRGSFITRVHYSLMNLGRWEGRAVAFVLGCGIGVLLRMIWVIAIVMYRTVRGQRSEGHQYSQITIIEEVVETPNSAPPIYTYPVDEKVVIPAEDVKTPSTPSTTEEAK